MAKPELKDHTGMLHQMARKAYARALGLGSSIQYDDLYQELCISFIKCANAFDESKGWKFSTLFVTSGWRHLNKVFEKEERHFIGLGIVSISDMSAIEEDGADANDWLEDAGDMTFSPESILEDRQEMELSLERFSPVARRIVEWCVKPPNELMAECQRIEAHKRMVSGGDPSPVAPNIREVCDFLILGGVDRLACEEARREVLTYAKTL